MTDSEIVKALECCTTKNGCCLDCPCWDYDEGKCIDFDHSDLFVFIKHQKAEIERLKKTRAGDALVIRGVRGSGKSSFVTQRVLSVRKATVNEFAEKLKPMHKVLCVDEGDWYTEIDNLVKEMVGDGNVCAEERS